MRRSQAASGPTGGRLGHGGSVCARGVLLLGCVERLDPRGRSGPASAIAWSRESCVSASASRRLAASRSLPLCVCPSWAASIAVTVLSKLSRSNSSPIQAFRTGSAALARLPACHAQVTCESRLADRLAGPSGGRVRKMPLGHKIKLSRRSVLSRRASETPSPPNRPSAPRRRASVIDAGTRPMLPQTHTGTGSARHRPAQPMKLLRGKRSRFSSPCILNRQDPTTATHGEGHVRREKWTNVLFVHLDGGRTPSPPVRRLPAGNGGQARSTHHPHSAPARLDQPRTTQPPQRLDRRLAGRADGGTELGLREV